MLHRYPKRQYQRLVLKHDIPTSTKSELETTTYEGENNNTPTATTTTIVPIHSYYLVIGILIVSAVGFGIYLLLANYVLFIWPFPKNTVINPGSSSTPPILSNNQYSSSSVAFIPSSSNSAILSSSSSSSPVSTANINANLFKSSLSAHESCPIPPIPFPSNDINNSPTSTLNGIMDVIQFAAKIQPKWRGTSLFSANWSWEMNQYSGMSISNFGPYNQLASINNGGCGTVPNPFLGYGSTQHVYPAAAFPNGYNDISIFAPISNYTIYVDSTNGNDVSNTGSINSAFQTLSRAYALAQIQTMFFPVTIMLRQGMYFFNQTFIISGISNLSIIAYPNEIVNISGGVLLPSSQWTLLTTLPSTMNSPPFPYNQTYSMPIPLWVNTSLNEHFNELWINGQRMIRARWPNRDVYRDSISSTNQISTSQSYLPCNSNNANPQTVITEGLAVYDTIEVLCSCGGTTVPCVPGSGTWVWDCPSPGPSSDYHWWSNYVYNQASNGTCAKHWLHSQNSWCSFLTTSESTSSTSGIILSWVWKPGYVSSNSVNYTASLNLNKGYIAVPAVPGGGPWGALLYELAGANYGTNTWNFGFGGFQFCRPWTYSGSFSDTPAFYDHFLPELDMPNEYFIDATNRILYHIPFNGTILQSSSIVASQVPTIFQINNSSHIVIRGLNFMHTTNSMMLPHQCGGGGDPAWSVEGAIVVINSSFVEISNNKFLEISGNGIVIRDQTLNITIYNNEFSDTGKSGIVVAGYMRSWNTSLEHNMPLNTWIKGNKMTGCGRQDYGAPCIEISLTTSTTIEENLLFYAPRALINLNDQGGGNHKIIRNMWGDGVITTGDHGGFNTWARSSYWTQSPVTSIWSWEPEVSELAYNYILPQFGKILDLDGAAWFNFHVHDNIIMDCDIATWGPNHQVFNNIGVISCNGIFGLEGSAPYTNTAFWNNTIYQLNSNDIIYYSAPCASNCATNSAFYYNNKYYYPSPGVALIYNGLTLDAIQNPITASSLGYPGLQLFQNETGSLNSSLPSTWPYMRPAIQQKLNLFADTAAIQYYSGSLGYCPLSTVSSPIVFQYTGADQSWVSTCSIANVYAIAAGGSSQTDGSQRSCRGGNGGVVNVTMSFTIGSTYTIIVGGGGWSDNPNSCGIPVSGYGGGAPGSRFGNSAGGGRTAIRDNSANELLSVGGGGGSGNYFPLKDYTIASGCNSLLCIPYRRVSCDGGSGGSAVGQDGGSNDPFQTDFSSMNGRGGSQLAGGFGGGNSPYWNIINPGSPFNNAQSGTQYAGGSGNNADYSSGGGGGWMGGGGGSFSPWSTGSGSSYGAAGGGSSNVANAAVLQIHGNWRGDDKSIPSRPNNAGMGGTGGVGSPGLLIINCIS